MIYLCAIALLGVSAALIWLAGVLLDRGRFASARTLLVFVPLMLVPGCLGLAFLYLRNLLLPLP